MSILESGAFDDPRSTRRFLLSLVGERFTGFIDFDSSGRKRRLFFEEGRVFNAQSAVVAENLCDLLQTQKRINSDQAKAAMAHARDKKITLESALIQTGAQSDAQVLQAIEQLCEVLVPRIALEAQTSYRATFKESLRGRMLGNLVELVPLLSEADASIRDASVQNKEAKAASARAEIRKAHARMKTATLYELLEVPEKASADEIRKHYFELAKRWHSDGFAGLDLGDEKDLLDEIFGAVGAASGTLSDPAKRADYDALLDRKRKGLPTNMSEIMNADGLFKRGEALLNRGENESALKDLEEAKRINPGEAEFWAVYAIALYLVKHDAKAAIAAAKQALTIDGTLARAHEVVGRILKGEGDFKKAKHAFEECLELNPKNINAARELRLMAMRKDSGKHTPTGGGILSKLFKK